MRKFISKLIWHFRKQENVPVAVIGYFLSVKFWPKWACR